MSEVQVVGIVRWWKEKARRLEGPNANAKTLRRGNRNREL